MAKEVSTPTFQRLSISESVGLLRRAAIRRVGGTTYQPYDGKEKKPVLIDPRKSKSVTLKVKNKDGGMHVDELVLRPKGFAKAASFGETVEAPEFDLPASVNDFQAGPFRCRLLGVSQETKETLAQFECRYTGKSVGWIDAASLGATIPSGQMYANDAKKLKRIMLKPGDTAKFPAAWHIEPRIADMQFTNMKIQWRATFQESALEEVEFEEVEYTLDEALTAEKND